MDREQLLQMRGIVKEFPGVRALDDVDLELRALSYSELDPAHKGYNLFLTYQKAKERQAARGVTADPAAYLGFDPSQRFR